MIHPFSYRHEPEIVGDILPRVLDGGSVHPIGKVARWLRMKRIEVPWNVVQVLENCQSGAEVLFALPFSRRPGCYVSGLNQFATESYTLTLQAPIGPYYADFLLEGHNLSIVVEVDGSHWHTSEKQRANDEARNAYMRSAGYTVVRFPARIATYWTDDCWKWLHLNNPPKKNKARSAA